MAFITQKDRTTARPNTNGPKTLVKARRLHDAAEWAIDHDKELEQLDQMQAIKRKKRKLPAADNPNNTHDDDIQI